MILNKKGLAVLPLAALLFASCSPWKGISYDKAKEFIDTNYKTDEPKELIPDNVHEKFNGTANNDESSIGMLQYYAFKIFYNTSVPGTKIDWKKGSPYSYEGDHKPEYGDYGIFPIKSEYDELVNVDSLTPEDATKSRTCVYETNGKKFKQTINEIEEHGEQGYSRCTEWRSYDEQGYRVEVYAKGDIKMNIPEPKMEVSCSYEYSATYTYTK